MRIRSISSSSIDAALRANLVETALALLIGCLMVRCTSDWGYLQTSWNEASRWYRMSGCKRLWNLKGLHRRQSPVLLSTISCAVWCLRWLKYFYVNYFLVWIKTLNALYQFPWRWESPSPAVARTHPYIAQAVLQLMSRGLSCCFSTAPLVPLLRSLQFYSFSVRRWCSRLGAHTSSGDSKMIKRLIEILWI